MRRISAEANKLRLWEAGITSATAVAVGFAFSLKQMLAIQVDSIVVLIALAVAITSALYSVVYSVLKTRRIRRSIAAESKVLARMTDFITDAAQSTKAEMGVFDRFILDARLSRLSLSAASMF